MNYHYKKEFSLVLRNGKKKHTIRTRPIAPGKMLKHIIYPYQPEKRECVLINICVSTQSIVINPGAESINEGKVWIDGRLLGIGEMQQLAWNDGFPSMVSFWGYFTEPTKGYIIHWTDLRY